MPVISFYGNSEHQVITTVPIGCMNCTFQQRFCMARMIRAPRIFWRKKCMQAFQERKCYSLEVDIFSFSSASVSVFLGQLRRFWEASGLAGIAVVVL